MRADNRFFAGLIQLGVFLLTLLALTFYANAQGLSSSQDVSSDIRVEEENNSIFKYRGIEASLGTRHLFLESDIPEISNLEVLQEGGNAAFTFGNSYSRITLRLIGLYYSAASISRTIDMLEMELSSNIYAFKAMHIPSDRFDFYFLTGVSNQLLRFYGHYIDKADRAESKGAAGREPYLGRISMINLNLGVGIEYKIERERDFVHVFLEGKSGFPLSTVADTEAFDNTRIEDIYALNIGVRFGRKN
ncbi:hypothetical protein C900_01540 [Fulvivirga imtechensis AK7]|uniref:Outer membrane protein beta-barrel domain-containing protein n=1 Tax=Fulvivirga imtechensis AK7 TaxID=1237149 RepID=L8JZ39_9BACT|nr:hypothetical protein [Fulvivirga imtechensis]ELR72457.1 hypothetical protein C900_01540 [Fulvivirga imtechensis AK7]